MANELIILVVDDDPSFREILSVKLNSEGMKVVTAENGHIALEMAKKHKPDLILMDVKMPELEGTEVALKLQEDEETKNLKLAFITQYGAGDDEGRKIDHQFAVSSGAVGYISKADDLNNIVEKVKSYLK